MIVIVFASKSHKMKKRDNPIKDYLFNNVPRTRLELARP